MSNNAQQMSKNVGICWNKCWHICLARLKTFLDSFAFDSEMLRSRINGGVLIRIPNKHHCKQMFLESCHISLILHLGNSTTLTTSLKFSPRRVDNLISGGPDRGRGIGKCFG